MAVKKTTEGKDYAVRLKRLSGAKWKVILDTQRPYRWNLKRLNLGKTLDVGCGIGRNLKNLPEGSVGVDHNKHAIESLREQGFSAFTTEEYVKKHTGKKNLFDSMLLAHVLEHMTPVQAKELLKGYMPFIKDKVVIICPQEKGYTTDETHVTFLDAGAIEDILTSIGLKIQKSYSFPFHRKVGKIFTYNETVVIASKK
jgi:SAM-dependent methyltransferase